MSSNLLYTPANCFASARNEAEVTSLLNNDIYKFLMLDFILAHKNYRDIPVRWEMTVRNHDIHLAEVIPEEQLRAQLEATQGINGVSEADISYLRGMTKGDGSPLFREETLTYLRTFKLPPYKLSKDGK